MLGIPEKGVITVHIKGYTDTVSYNVYRLKLED
jgi:hypothetical protein